MIKLIFAIISIIILILFIVYSVIPAIQKVTATERVEYTKERERLLVSKGCIETGRDPVTIMNYGDVQRVLIFLH
jgi:uncharacterized membrane protein